MAAVTVRGSFKMFGGLVKQLQHQSAATATPMNFTVFLPPQAASAPPRSIPAVYWLSGLTCTDDNFITKAGAQRRAAELGLALVAPDTSPRGAGIEGEDDAYDFGSGAGFYVNATATPWAAHYNMFDYVTRELPGAVEAEFPQVCTERRAVSGHSMGGHGALVCALKNPGLYRSVSAFAPIVNPTKCPWGRKAFDGYFGPGGADGEGRNWDATELVSKYAGPPLDILIDQGLDDQFYKEQLLTDNFTEDGLNKRAASDTTVTATVRKQEGYDHSYYTIATFIDDHLDHHARFLLGEGAQKL